MSDDSLFTFQNLGTIGGASLLCFLIVAYTKGLIDIFAPWVPTNVYSLLVASSILILVQLNLNSSALYMWQTYFLALANGFLISATASHTNELATRFPKLIRKNKEEPSNTQTKTVISVDNDSVVNETGI